MNEGTERNGAERNGAERNGADWNGMRERKKERKEGLIEMT